MGGLLLLLGVVAINLVILQVIWFLSGPGPDRSGVGRREGDPVWLFGDPHTARRKYEEHRAGSQGGACGMNRTFKAAVATLVVAVGFTGSGALCAAIGDMTVRNLSPATQQSYLNAVSKFSRHFGRYPDRLGLEDVRAFQVHLVATGISWPALNQIVCALRFFYGVTLGHAIIPERIAYAREPRKLPVVLSADEVVASWKQSQA
jgi:Phage integrase, N-terminal SAM-like domain